MKTLELFAKENNLIVVSITYNFKGIAIKRKGFDLIDSNRNIFASFEPKFYTSHKWLLRNGKSKSGVIHFSRLTKEVLNDLVWSEYPSGLR